MAKVKPDTPKKGKKPGTIQKAATVLRRSPRKAVQSAKKLAAGEAVSPGKVVKRTATKKAPVPTKASAKSAQKSEAAGTKTSKPQLAKRAGSATLEIEPATSPKRGRPKKETKAGSAKAKKTTPGRASISSRTRSQTPEDVAEVPVPTVDDEWTDSPKKRNPSKTGPKRAAPKAASTRKKATASVTKAGPGSIRKSIEVPDTKTKERSPSRVRKPSASPAQGRSKAVLSSNTRAHSANSVAGSKRAHSRSPVRRISDKSSNTASTRAQSRSPIRKSSQGSTTTASSSAQSQIPVRRSSKTSTASNALKFQDAIQPSARSRSVSPAKKLSTNKDAGARSPIHSARSRSKSPAKGDARKYTRTSPASSVLSPPVQSPKARGRPRGPSVVRQHNPLRVEKTRGAGSPTKRTLSEPRRTRSASPKKSERSKGGTRKLSDPTPSPGSGRPRGRATSPSKPAEHQTQGQRRPSTQAAFEKRFTQNDDYGQALRRVERTAYRCQRAGEDPVPGRHPHVTKEDETMAKERGIRRAELENSLHTKGAVVPRRSLSAPRAHGRVSDSEDLLDDLVARGRPAGVNNRSSTVLSRQRRRSSGNSQQSPQHSPGRKRSTSNSSVKDSDDVVPLAKGEPSGKGRGAIHSVTNQEFIPETSTLRKNPFFETMPAPEIWHRRMAPFLPFGETPFMEREMSRQISEDLSRGAEQSQSTWSIARYLPSFGKGKKSSAGDRPYKSPWTLPEISDSEVNAAVNELRNFIDKEVGMGAAKRQASGELSYSPVKRARRRSAGRRDENDYMMSGAL